MGLKTVSLDGQPRSCTGLKTISALESQKPRPVSREDSALRKNIAEKGSNAYYFAHNREFVVPEDAKVVTGPGLITGGAPTLISKEEEPAPMDECEACSCPTQWIRDFSWADAGVGKAKVYLELPAGALQREDQVRMEFRSRGLECVATNGTTYRCKIEPLYAEILPEECSYRVSLEKSRVTMTLKKKRNSTWDDLQKK